MPPGKTQAQINAEAIAPGRQPTEPYNGWGKLPPNTQNILASRGYTRETFNAPGAAKAREATARYPLNASSFSNKLIDKAIPMVGAGAPPKPLGAAQIGAANVGSFAGSLMGAGSGGLSSLPVTAMSGQTIKPVKGGASIDLNQGTVTPTTPTMGKQGEAMNDKQMFKVAFLAKCVEDGLTIDQIHVRVKQALALVEKNAEGKSLFDTLNPLPLIRDAGYTGLGLAALGGAGSYYLGNKLLGPAMYQATKAPIPSKEDLLQEELANEYDRQTEIIKRQTEMTRRKRERDRGMSGVTRY
jgi:hypothetical protein